MRLHPTFRPFYAFMVFNCNWWGSYSEKGVFNRCDCVPTSSFFMLLGYSIATGRYSIFSKMILTSKKHLGEIALGAFNTITDRN